ncbi:MAG: hypothetical protein K0B09_04750 [Bacteroidales bacterium]|nr:hypothetical protein [Bacteroidales bacterium]
MKNINFIISVLAFFMVLSCSGPVKNESDQSSNLMIPEQDQTQELPANEETYSALSQEPDQPVAEQVEAQVMLNPPHGQPYHRCDIPVGSPLPPAGSAPQATTNPVAASAPVTTPAPAASPATATVDKSMIPTVENINRLNSSQGSQSNPPSGTPPVNNPPHGQPWHRCDIPVGSPLPR